MACYVLPQYSPSLAAPEYSYEPTCGERTLQLTPRSARPTPASTFIKHAGKTTVVLHNQEENAKVPTYGRGSIIAGSILFDNVKNVSKVVLKISGRLESTSSEGGARAMTLVDNTQVLWSDDREIGRRCPSQICFSIPFPLTFRGEEGDRPLPPSYVADFVGVPGLFVRSSYSLQILITKALSRKVDFLAKTKLVLIPFEYRPRTRPQRPIVASPCFFSGIKATPEEWYQVTTPMKTSPDVEVELIHTHLFVPSARIYGIRDSIPFHVQLNGPAQSLREFLQPISGEHPGCTRRPKSPEKRTSTSCSPSRSLPSLTRSQHKWATPSPISTTLQPALKTTDLRRPKLRVFLLRQVTIETHLGKAWRNQIVGEAELVPVPPLLSTSFPSGIAELEEDHLDWEGELRVNEKFTVGGWQAGDVHVKDFIALSVLPQYQPTSASSGILLTVPARLVTDSWTEGGLGFDRMPLEAWM